MLHQLFQKQGHILICPQVVGSGSLYQAVEDGAGLGAAEGVDHHPVLPAQSKWPDCLFRTVVVHRDITVLKEDAQKFFLVDAVLQAFISRASGGNFRDLGFCPCEKGVHRGFYGDPALPFAFCFGKVIQFVVQMEDAGYLLYCLG